MKGTPSAFTLQRRKHRLLPRAPADCDLRDPEPDEDTAKKKLLTEKGQLTRRVLARHFRGASEGDLIGLHALSLKNTCRWLAIDIDLHDDADPEQAGGNRRAAVRYWRRLKEAGFTPLLLASNGRGGFHLVVLFDAPVPT
jgi:hypothetical protein